MDSSKGRRAKGGKLEPGMQNRNTHPEGFALEKGVERWKKGGKKPKESRKKKESLKGT